MVPIYPLICRGNCILVGSLGQPLESMAQISLYIAGYELQSLDVSNESKFKESFRALFRQTGLEGKALSIIVTVSYSLIPKLHLPFIFPFFHKNGVEPGNRAGHCTCICTLPQWDVLHS